MRKLVVLSFVSLDGVMQAPGGPKEDTSGGFKYGGWTVPYADETTGKIMARQMEMPFELLLGRKTYDIFANYWPKQDEKTSQVAAKFNKTTKYVASRHHQDLQWANTKLIAGDVLTEIKNLKQKDGPMLQVHGSGDLIQTLLQHDLVDEMWLKIFPVTLGSGKRLFDGGTIPAAFQLSRHEASKKGVIFAEYIRAGEVEIGSFE